MKKIILSITVILSLSGCTGKLYTIINPDLPTDGNTTEKKIEGILTYSEVNVVELYKTTILVDEGGNQIGTTTSGYQCIPKYKTEFSTRIDYSNPKIVVYEAGLFEFNTFAFTLEKGVLKSVNITSNPTAALPNIASVMPFFKAQKDPVDEAKPLCNEGLRLVGIYKAPKIKSFRKMPK